MIDLNLPLGGAAINLGIKAEHSIVNAFRISARLDSQFSLRLAGSSMAPDYPYSRRPVNWPPRMSPMMPSTSCWKSPCQNFDYVVVDAGSKLNLQHTHLFDESATIYLVTQVGIAELRNSNRLIAHFSAAGSPKLEIVINRYDPLNLEIADEHITKALTRPAEWKIPNDYAAVRRMQNTATPLMEDDSEISRAIRQMTKSVCSQRVRKRHSGSAFR